MLPVKVLSRIKKWPKLRIQATLLFSAMVLVVLIELVCFYHGVYYYPHVPEDEIYNELYRMTAPSLPRRQRPCDYNAVIYNHRTLDTWEIPKKYNEFSAQDIQNGSFTPACDPAFSVAILVTYRNRQKQLDIFLPYMHNFLRAQNIHYKIYLIEQKDSKPWNKGMLYNIGAKRAIADKFPCLILHDVDLLPLDLANLYVCTRQPRHMSASIDKFRYVLPYEELVGGVLAIRSDQYVQLDGFSHRFEGWGGEDDDIYERIKKSGLDVIRFPMRMAHYSMVPHPQEPRNQLRKRILSENRGGRQLADGYSHMPYANVEVREHRLFTLVGVNF